MKIKFYSTQELFQAAIEKKKRKKVENRDFIRLETTAPNGNTQFGIGVFNPIEKILFHHASPESRKRIKVEQKVNTANLFFPSLTSKKTPYPSRNSLRRDTIRHS